MPDECSAGDELQLDTENGIIKNITTGREYSIPPFSPEIQELIDVGGLVNYTKKKLGV